MMRVLLLAVALTAIPAQAQELPSKPVASQEFIAYTSALAAAWTMDAVSTHQSFAKHPTYSEIGFLNNGSRSTPKIMATWALVDVGAVVVSYEWKRHVRNKYLHPLWRVPMLFMAQGHARMAVSNWRQR